MPTGRDVTQVVSVSLSLSRLTAGYQNFGVPIFIGAESFLDPVERVRAYTNLEGVLADVQSGSPLALSAALYFSQVPQPTLLYLGRWVQTASSGVLHGAILTPSQQLLSNFTAITSGSMKITVDGTPYTLTGLNFGAQTNLNGVASVIQSALVTAGATGARVIWGGVNKRFDVISGTTGTSSSVSYATANTSGTDVSGPLGLVTGRASVPVPGFAAETLAQAITTISDKSNKWYAAIVCAATPPATSDHIAAAAIIEGLARRRMYGITTQDTACLDSTRSDDICSQMKALGYNRTFIQYSSSSPYAVCSMIGRAATVDFNANNTTVTLKFKGEPGVIAEDLPESQYQALQGKNGNCYTYYNNGVAILEQGVMSSGYFFDVIQGTDWYANYVQTNLFNALVQAPTKIPQTDSGMNILKNVIDGSAEQAVTNGLVAPGQWNLPGFGHLAYGDHLDLGYYTYAPPIDSQPQAVREKRVSVAFQQALKLAGAVHSVPLALTVNQ